MRNPQYRSIEIDFEVHQIIELEKKGFHESDNGVLRRLLRLDENVADGQSSVDEVGVSWVGKGVELPQGTKLRMFYNKKEHLGNIQDGKWSVQERLCSSPSQAAGIVAGGKSLNGWLYWSVKRPSDTDWIPINSLRVIPSLSGGK